MTDNDDNLIEAYSLNITEESEGKIDQFEKSADEVRSMRGLGSATKRRMTRKINKAASGLDDSGSKSKEAEAITGYDVLGVVQPPHNMDALTKVYELSNIHLAAVDAKVSNIVGLGHSFSETPKTRRKLEQITASKNQERLTKAFRRLDRHKEELNEMLENMNDEDSFIETMTKMWKDFETTGNGYLEVGRRNDGRVGYIGHISSPTMRVRRERDGYVQMSGHKVTFFRNFGDTDTPNPINNEKTNEIIHFKNYSPTNAYYGVPAIVSAEHAIAGNEFASRFNLDYFENKAIPKHIITLKGGELSRGAERKLLQFFESKLKGQNHRSLFIPLPSGTKDNPVEFDIKSVEADIQDASFSTYRQINMQDILVAHRVPQTKIAITAESNVASALDAARTFKEQVCGPSQTMIEKRFNKIIREFTDAFDFKLNEMTLTDADTQSKINERNRKAGIVTANEVRSLDGWPRIEGGDELFDLNGNSGSANETRAEERANRDRDSRRTANATDSNGESRNPAGEGRTDGTE